METIPLTHFEDRRRYLPPSVSDFPKSYPSKTRVVAKVLAVKPKKNKSLQKNTGLVRPIVLGFTAPKKVLICVRRKVRKEVLHAIRKTGKSGQKRPRRNFYSDIRC